ncbi:MAG: ATP-binding cassette domain-containing protein [Deltaproteobacteria bacterium]|nr:ATP-binding cassette domain-containing protein [Deltaproteobacteria bacterium]
MIILDQVSKLYGGTVQALQNVSLHVGRGECKFVIGSTGAGKTTLIKLICALEQPTSGLVSVLDHDLSSADAGRIQALRRHMGVIFQDYRLIEDWSTYDNLAVVLEVMRKPPFFVRQRVWKVLKLVGLQHKVYQKAKHLSGGEKKRLALGRAIIHEPDILLADEPLGSLDEAMAAYVMNQIVQLSRKGMAVLITTHTHHPLMQSGAVVNLMKGSLRD